MLPDQPCEVCWQRLDAVLWSAGRHPGCSSPAPLSDDAFHRLAAAVAAALGAGIEHPEGGWQVISTGTRVRMTPQSSDTRPAAETNERPRRPM